MDSKSASRLFHWETVRLATFPEDIGQRSVVLARRGFVCCSASPHHQLVRCAFCAVIIQPHDDLSLVPHRPDCTFRRDNIPHSAEWFHQLNARSLVRPENATQLRRSILSPMFYPAALAGLAQRELRDRPWAQGWRRSHSEGSLMNIAQHPVESSPQHSISAAEQEAAVMLRRPRSEGSMATEVEGPAELCVNPSRPVLTMPGGSELVTSHCGVSPVLDIYFTN